MRAEQLRAAGYDVASDLPEPPVLLRQLRSDPPAAVIVDLSRVPSRGRDVALTFRTYKDTRGVPLVLVDYKICSIDEIWSALLFRRRKG